MGPDYQRPKVYVPPKFTETPKNWKIASPKDQTDRGAWWKIFNDNDLNTLEDQANECNQSIAIALAQYQQARALVDEARAAFFPLVTGTADITRQRQGSDSSTFVSTSTTGAVSTGAASTGSSIGSTHPVTTTHTLGFNASWEPDLWGSVRQHSSLNSGFISTILFSNARLR
jgi:outer membrane protein TolC